MTNDNAEIPAIELPALVGRTILVGVTYYDAEGAFESQQQLHGTVTSVDRKGIHIALAGARTGEIWTMPPDTRAVQAAKPGVYTLRSSNETITDPDYLATWTIQHPAKQ